MSALRIRRRVEASREGRVVGSQSVVRPFILADSRFAIGGVLDAIFRLAPDFELAPRVIADEAFAADLAEICPLIAS